MPLKSPFKKSRSKPAPKPSPKGKAASSPPAKSTGPATPKKPASRRAAAPPPPPPPLFNLSDERKLDVLGVALAVSGVLMILALVSATHDMPIGFVLDIFWFMLGWGTLILPVGLILFGGWLVLRKIDRIPPVSVE